MDAHHAEVTEVVPGEYDVRMGDHQVRVLVPAGVGVPGLADDDVAGALVEELIERGSTPTDVVDLSTLLRTDPTLLDAIADRCDPDG